MPLSNGATFAGFRIVRLLGSGGMGEVYLAQHPRLPKQIALKVLPTATSSDGEFRERFAREADLAATLYHPHIVGVHDRGESDAELWIAMDFVDGSDASRLLADRYPAGMPTERVFEIVSVVAGALDYAHRRGMLHRDVKPANIMVTNDEEGEQRVLLADFGIARDLNEISGLTATNMTVGTVAYAAPEQLLGESTDGRADQYALAATAYHLLTGSQLYPYSNPAVVIGRHLNAPVPALADIRPHLAALDPILAAALAKNPKDRFSSCTDFARALTESSTLQNPRMAAAAPTTPAAVARQDHSPSLPSETAGASDQYGATRTTARNLIGAFAVAVLLLIVVGLLWRPWQQPQPNTAATPSSQASTALASAPPPISLSATPEPAPPSVDGAPPEGYYTDVRRAFSTWNDGQGLGTTSGTTRVLTEVFDWVCQHEGTEPNVVNQQIQMQETWFNHPSLQPYESNRLRSIAMSYCPKPSAPTPVTNLPATTVAPSLNPTTTKTPSATAYDSVCSFLHGQGDQWPDGPYLHSWMLARYPDLPPNQVDNILETAFQDPACQGP
jgi:serine/threonine protein kinase, bacterial